MLNLKSLLKQILTFGIFKSGVTMTGQLKTSFRSFVASGMYTSTQTTIPDLINEVKMSSGAMGTITTSSDYTNNSLTLSAGTYQFIYLPHRYGGVNGTTPTTTGETDNCKYGNLILIYSNLFVYIINLNNNNIRNAYCIHTSYWSGNTSVNNAIITINKTTNNYYSFVDGSTWGFTVDGRQPRIKVINFYIQCNAVTTSWQKIGSYTCSMTPAYPSQDFNFSLTNSAGTVLQCYIDSSGNIYARGGNVNHGFEGTITFK